MARPPEPGATRSRYSSGAILFHWLIAALVIANVLGAKVTDSWEGPARGAVMELHKATGLTILALSLARLAWRLAHRPPPLPPQVGRMEAVAAKASHWAFYVLMIAMPVSGWLMVSASSEPRPFRWYGLFDAPFLPVQGEKMLQVFAHDAHEWLGWLFIALIALHVAGALRHHFTNASGFIGRMWFGGGAARR